MVCDTSPLNMEPKSQVREIRKLTEAPDSMVGNGIASAEDGTQVAAFATGSQLAPYASTADEVILADSQEIVPVLESAFRRIREMTYLEMIPCFGKRIMGYIRRQDPDHRA